MANFIKPIREKGIIISKEHKDAKERKCLVRRRKLLLFKKYEWTKNKS